MKIQRPFRIGRLRTSATSYGFTLIEILVVVVLLSLIILGLMEMFDQTEKAFRAGTAQTDQLEAGRMFNDLLVRDMEQIVPTGRTNTLNFWTEIPNYGSLQPLMQYLPPTSVRTDLLEDLYFVSRANQTISSIGYFVRTNPSVSGNVDFVGSLYRYQTNIPVGAFNSSLPDASVGSPFQAFLQANSGLGSPNGVAPSGNNVAGVTSISKVLDGVVEFRVHCYDTNGYFLNQFSRINYPSNSIDIQNWAVSSNEVQTYAFSNNIVPAYVEVQLGVLEPAVLKRYNSIPNVTARQNYLSNHASSVQLFRMRIPIRNVDPSAYVQ